MISGLVWIGARARWVLALGCCAALFLPTLSAFIRPALPGLVAMVMALSMARIDLAAEARRAVRPARLARTAGLTLLLIPATAALLFGLSRVIGLDPADEAALIYLAAAPPIASSAGLCFLLGLNAAFAVELMVVATLLTPLIGPATAALFLGDAGLAPLDLALRLAAMIAAGCLAAVAIRTALGAARIARSGAVFDGVATLGMLLFVIPLFDGVGETILADPLRALRVLALATAANFGLHLAVTLIGRGFAPRATAGGAGVMWGNRTVAIYLAALPADPLFGLFVALYQFPMYFTPLAMGWLHRTR